MRPSPQAAPKGPDELVRRLWNPVLSSLLRTGLSDADARDVAQEAFAWAHINFGRCPCHAGWRSWMFRIAFYKRNEYLRSERAELRRVALFGDACPDALHHDPTVAIDSRKALGFLTEPQRDAFVLYVLQEMSAREVADTLSISETAVRARVADARARIETWQKEDAANAAE